ASPACVSGEAAVSADAGTGPLYLAVRCGICRLSWAGHVGGAPLAVQLDRVRAVPMRVLRLRHARHQPVLSPAAGPPQFQVSALVGACPVRAGRLLPARYAGSRGGRPPPAPPALR